jgi:NIMA-interacting peptidyl-prolyl cis-trans isomerase 1
MRNRPALASSLLLAAVSFLGCDPPNPAPDPVPTAGPLATTMLSATATATATAPAVPEREIAGASQILVTYKGAELAAKTVTRSKADAQKLAGEVLDKIKTDGMPFEDAVKKYSDDEGSKRAAGAMGNFEKNVMPEAFSKATFGMPVGEISPVVETPRGFHIIKRTR